MTGALRAEYQEAAGSRCWPDVALVQPSVRRVAPGSSSRGDTDAAKPPMPVRLARQFCSDARHFQIVALGALLAVNFAWLDFGASPVASVLALVSSVATQAVCARLKGLPSIDLRSPLITGLSLSLLLRADELWLHAAAGSIAILSKFVLRIDGKHIWNPAGFAIVALLALSGQVWISPGQWGTSIWFAALVCFLAILVLRAAHRADIALFFLGSHALLLLARAIWLGDPISIPLHQLQSGSLLIFAFFMISDPRTSPDSWLGRLLFALAVALFGHWLAFFMQLRPALYLALIALSPAILILDKVLPAARFAWTRPATQGVSP
jgi:enediyne biosynthesis protein E5